MIKKALIVGGGIAGMCAAISLKKIGVETQLVEIEEKWGALGAGLTMNGASLRAFREIGVLDRIMERGYTHDVRRLYDGQGELLFESTPERIFGEDVPNGGGILRPVLHEILREEMERQAIPVRLGLTVEALDERDDGVCVTFTDQTKGVYDLVVGADGIHSPMRERLFPGVVKSEFTGQGCWRAVVPRPDSITGGTMFLGNQKVGVNPVSNDEMYLFLLQHVPDNPWMEHSRWVEILKSELEEFGGLIGEIRDNLTNDHQVHYGSLMIHLMPAPWHKGRVLLIGDAAHSTTPHAAYGAGMAVEDAVVLSRLIAEDLPLAEVFERFMERRYDKCRLVIEGSVNIGKVEMAHGSGDDYRAAWDEVYKAVKMPI